MIIINNGTQDYEINEKDIQYFFKYGLELRFVNKLSTENIVFDNRSILRAAVDQLVTGMHKQLATIPALFLGAGVIFWVYCPNISAHTVSDNTITITHQSGTQEITCINSEAASHHNQRLYYSYTANHLPEYIEGKRLLYVRPDYTNDNYLRLYSSWTNALNKSKTGDVIIIEPGDYEITEIKLKNKVDAIVLPGAVFTKTDDDTPYMIHCNNKTVDSKIFGEGIYSRSYSNNFGNASLLEVNGNNSRVFFQFNELHCGSIFSLHSSEGSVWMKGYLGDVFRIQDSDNNSELVDIDVLRSICSGEGYYPDNNSQTYFYALNGYLQSAMDGMYMQNIEGDYDITLCNMKIEASGGTGIQILGAGQDGVPDNVRVWFSEINAPSPYVNMTESDAEVNIYDDLIVSNEFTGGNYTFPGAEPTVDAGLTMGGNMIDGNTELGPIGELGFEVSGNHLILIPEIIDNAAYYYFYKNNILIGISDYSHPSLTLKEVYTGEYNIYSYEGRREMQTTSLSNFTLIPQIMALTNKPRKSKYTVGDTVYYNNSGAITELTVKGVRAVVQNPDNTAHGVQYNYYAFEEIPSEYREERLYSSKNHLLSSLKQDYLNVAFNAAEFPIIENIDLAGFDLQYIDMTATGRVSEGIDAVLDNAIFDNANLTGVTFPTDYDTKAEFKAAVKSYDNKSTIWKDGYPIKDWNGFVMEGNYHNEYRVLVNPGYDSMEFGLLDVVKGNNWTIAFSTAGSASVAVNTETKAIAIHYISGITTIPEMRAIINADTDFTANFHVITTDGTGVITTTSTFTYYAWTGDDLSAIDLTGIYAENTDFTGCTMPTAADTKAEFKALVASWDPVNTIWTDGEPIGS